MSDFQNYMLAQARLGEAQKLFNYAQEHLENAQIHDRLAEIKSQHEPLAGLIDAKMSERDRLYAAAFYAVVGRMPEADHPKNEARAGRKEGGGGGNERRRD